MNVELGKGPVEEYLAGVRAALADLPGPEVAEIVDDVRGHLSDVRAEVGEDADLAGLTARLGTPETYAAELRAAAGYAPPPPPPAGADGGSGAAMVALVALIGATALVLLFGFSFVLSGVGPVGLVEVLLLTGFVLLAALPALTAGGPRMATVAALPAVRRAVQAWPDAAAGGVPAFVVSLQPAWWVVRALTATAVVAAVLGGEPVVVLVVAVLFVPASVLLGRLSQRDRRWIWAVVPLNALAVVLVPVVLLSPVSLGSNGPASVSSPYLPGLWQDGERQILDIRPVDALGNPLTDVYLFDQDGRPIDTGDECEGYADDLDYGRATPVAPYPRGSARYDESTGECVLMPPGPLVVAVPSAVPSTTEPPPVPTAPVPAPSGATDPPPPTVPASPTG